MNEPKAYLAHCIDPIHVGTGGYRLGRVDMSIVREPASGIPKVPGTSIAGVVRAYAELARKENEQLPDIPTVFGTTEGDQGKQGMLRFYDADIVLFPIATDRGTTWLSTIERLRKWLEPVENGTEVVIPNALVNENKVVILKGEENNNNVINLGWLLLETEKNNDGSTGKIPESLGVVTRLCAVSEKLFFHLVNDNLETRTSVNIDNETGAASEKMLFTYEAISRGTVLGFEIAVDERRGEQVSGEQASELLAKALEYMSVLGVGGMGTRGFGRLDVSDVEK